MPPEQAPAEGTPSEPASPPPAAPGIEQQPAAPTEGENWQKRYEDLRPQYDRTHTQLNQYQQLIEGLQSQDPATRQQAAQGLGLELVDETPADGNQYVDPTDELRQEVAAMKAAMAQRDQEAQQASRLQDVEAHVEQQLGTFQGLGDEEKDWIVARAVHLAPTPEGMPDIQAAAQQWEALVNKTLQSRAAVKRSAPHVSPVGTAGTETPSLKTHAQRSAWMAEQLRADQ